MIAAASCPLGTGTRRLQVGVSYTSSVRCRWRCPAPAATNPRITAAPTSVRSTGMATCTALLRFMGPDVVGTRISRCHTVTSEFERPSFVAGARTGSVAPDTCSQRRRGLHEATEPAVQLSRGGRLMRIMFIAYLALIVGGLTYFFVIGFLNR
jgi:hypothetical protein